jgi:hypothetical protein
MLKYSVFFTPLMNFRCLKIINNTSYEIVIVFRIVKIQLTAVLNARSLFLLPQFS